MINLTFLWVLLRVFVEYFVNRSEKEMKFFRRLYARVLAWLAMMRALYYIKGKELYGDNFGTGNNAGQIIIVLISVFIGAVFGLYLTPSFATACTQASYAFNGSAYEVILDLVFTMILPILWAVIMISILAGAGVGIYRMVTKIF